MNGMLVTFSKAGLGQMTFGETSASFKRIIFGKQKKHHGLLASFGHLRAETSSVGDVHVHTLLIAMEKMGRFPGFF